MTAPTLTTTLHGDHRTGWHWTCTCGRAGEVGNDHANVRKSAATHTRRHRKAVAG